MSEQVRQMFADISDKYDDMNRIITMGMDQGWRKKLVEISGAKFGDSILDCASGTGDLAIEFKKKVGTTGKVIATDFCAEMLDYIEPKAKKNNFDIEVEQADVMNLRFSDNSFDVASISYGIRNVDDPIKGLDEMARVVKPGGVVMVLETGQPSGLMKIGYKLHGKLVIPLIGAIYAGNRQAYKYLPETASKFPYGNKFIELMKATNKFSETKAYPMFFGVSYIYLGRVK